MEEAMRVGIDLGGTKIEGVALDGSGQEIIRLRVPTPREQYDRTILAIRDLIAHIEQTTGRRGSVGVGTPGAVSPATRKMKNANSTWLNGRPLRQDLEDALGRPVRTENDANCLAVSEATDGAGVGAQTVFAVILGTGVGAGIAVGQRVMTGANAIAGEWGHNPMPWPTADEWPGRHCYCGRTGCIETVLSGPGLEQSFRIAADRELSGPDIVAAAEYDPMAAAVLDAWRHQLARALAHVVNILDPDVIVLGGGLSNIPGLAETVPALWMPYVFSDTVVTPVRRAKHGDSSGVRGAAWLWPETAGSVLTDSS